INKARNWWKARENLVTLPRGSLSLSSRLSSGRTRSNVKALPGRGRRQSEWVKWIYPHLLSEFDRLRKAGLKFDSLLLKHVAQLGKEKIESIERQVAYHLGQLQREFASGELDENCVENIDETHFVIDFDNGRTLGFIGETQIRYADVVSGGEGMTMVVRISGGQNARVLPPMMIFTNSAGNYPIRGVPDNVDGVSYRTGPKGWMSKKKFREYLTEPRAMRKDWKGRKKHIFLDNCSGHLSNDECPQELLELKAELRYLSANATDLCQPADSFVIAKIKDVWAQKWNQRKIDLIEGGKWQNNKRNDGSWSGKLRNPGKSFFLHLATETIREVNSKKMKTI
ncbi:hypothetical protein PHMEG_00037609, partial [Phytophthora megakarya]